MNERVKALENIMPYLSDDKEKSIKDTAYELAELENE
jgi:hypothetical protein